MRGLLGALRPGHLAAERWQSLGPGALHLFPLEEVADGAADRAARAGCGGVPGVLWQGSGAGASQDGMDRAHHAKE